MQERRNAGDRSSPKNPANQPAAVGPSIQPMSPPRARMAYVRIDIFGIFTAARL